MRCWPLMGIADPGPMQKIQDCSPTCLAKLQLNELYSSCSFKYLHYLFSFPKLLALVQLQESDLHICIPNCLFLFHFVNTVLALTFLQQLYALLRFAYIAFFSCAHFLS